MGNLFQSLFTTLFLSFLIIFLGNWLGKIHFGIISFQTAGVLLVGLLFGVFTFFCPVMHVGGTDIVLYDADIKSQWDLLSRWGSIIFIDAVGLNAGKVIFSKIKKDMLLTIANGLAIVATAGIMTFLVLRFIPGLDKNIIIGVLAGALSSTPSLIAGREAAGVSGETFVAAGYGIAYIFGVIGVVLFVQIIPHLLHVDMALERNILKSGNHTNKSEIIDENKKSPEPDYSSEPENLPGTKEMHKERFKLDPYGINALVITAVFGGVLGSIRIPGVNFSLGFSGGTLITGIIIGHFGHIGRIDMEIDDNNLTCFREIGLMWSLAGAGVPAGNNFIQNFQPEYFIIGCALTIVPMFVGFFISMKINHFHILQALGIVTGGMTSTPALDTLIFVSGTDRVSQFYATVYPFAMIFLVLMIKLL